MSQIFWFNIFIFVISIFCAFYVGPKAKEAEKSKSLWGLLGLFFGFLAVSIFYFRVKENKKGSLFLALYIVLIVLYNFFGNFHTTI